MDAWVPLATAIAGAAIAILGQQLARHGERRTRGAELLLEQCAQLVAMNEEFGNLVWEEHILGRQGRVETWDLPTARLVAARLRILCDDRAVLDALSEMRHAGRHLGSYWRRGEIDADELNLRFERLKEATEAFVEASALLVRSHLNHRTRTRKPR